MTSPVMETADALITANAVKSEVRDQQLSYTPNENSLHKSMSLLGNSLGGAVLKYLEAEQTGFIETKKLDAAARQGQEAAVNSVDAEAERTGWKKALFGQDEGFEVATARAAENTVRDAYMEEATTIDNYAALSPEEYKTRLQDRLTKALEQNPDNKLYRQSVTDAWVKGAEKLAARQYEANTAYNQLTSRANADKQIRQELDIVNIDLQSARTPEDLVTLQSEMHRILRGDTLPQNMHPVARRAAVNEAVFASISQGNIGVYNILKQMGYDKELTGKEQAQLDTALQQYTQDWHYDIVKKFEEAELAAINEGTDLEAAKQTWFRLDEQLNALKLRSANTPQADSILAKYFSASAGKRSLLDDMKERLLAQGAKVDVKAASQQALKAALRVPTLQQSGAISSVVDTWGPVSKEDLVQAFDSNLIEDITALVGSDKIFESQQAVSAALTDSNVARVVGGKVKLFPHTSKIVQRSFEHVIGGFSSEQFIDPRTKQATPELITAVGNLRLMAGNNAKIPLDGDLRVVFGLLERGINNQRTIPKIEADINSYLENKDKQGVGEHWDMIEKQDVPYKLDYIKQIVSEMGGGEPKGNSLLDYMDIYKEGLTIHGGDHSAAKNYLRDFVGNKNLTYKGTTIVGGKKLDDLTGSLPFDATLDWVQTKIDSHGDTVFNGYMRHLAPPDKKKDGSHIYPSNLDQMGWWRMKVEEGYDGVIIYGEHLVQPWRIPRETLSDWSRRAMADRKVKEEAEAAKWKAREERHLAEQQIMHYKGY